MSDTDFQDVRLSTPKVIGLVAGRELSTRLLRSKAFKIMTAVLVLIIVGFAVVMKLMSGSGFGDATVGVLQKDTVIAAPLEAVAKSIGQTVDAKTVADERVGRQQVVDGKLDALIVNAGGRMTVIVKKDIDGDVRNALNILAGQLALDEEILAQKGDPAKVRQAVAQAQVDVQPMEKPFDYNGQQLVLGIITGILIYMSLLIHGQSVAQGVVEEKSSRVVELLLATIRPWQLMAGKVLGIGIVGLIQMVIIGVVGVVAGLALDVLTISVSAAVSTVVWLVVWYLLGFFMYALAFAAMGALVSRQEDIGSVTAPVLMFVIAGYVVGISVLPSDPSNFLVEVLSIIPVFAPTLMPMRLAMGGVPAWEAALSLGLVVAMIPLLIWLSGRIYRNAVMRTGARVKLRDALRPA